MKYPRGEGAGRNREFFATLRNIHNRKSTQRRAPLWKATRTDSAQYGEREVRPPGPLSTSLWVFNPTHARFALVKQIKSTASIQASILKVLFINAIYALRQALKNASNCTGPRSFLEQQEQFTRESITWFSYFDMNCFHDTKTSSDRTAFTKTSFDPMTNDYI